MAEPLLALTILQPWEWAVSKGLKPPENRGWMPPPGTIGRYIALHAGKRIDAEGVPSFTRIIRRAEMQPRINAVHSGPLSLSMMPLGAITAVGRLARVVTLAEQLPEWQRPWFVGRFAWVFEEVLELPEPVPCRGFQKLWTVPDDVAELVRAGWKRATARQCRHCHHPEHFGICTGRSGGTAYSCGCHHDAERP